MPIHGRNIHSLDEASKFTNLYSTQGQLKRMAKRVSAYGRAIIFAGYPYLFDERTQSYHLDKQRFFLQQGYTPDTNVMEQMRRDHDYEKAQRHAMHYGMGMYRLDNMDFTQTEQRIMNSVPFLNEQEEKELADQINGNWYLQPTQENDMAARKWTNAQKAKLRATLAAKKKGGSRSTSRRTSSKTSAVLSTPQFEAANLGKARDLMQELDYARGYYNTVEDQHTFKFSALRGEGGNNYNIKISREQAKEILADRIANIETELAELGVSV